ncbi:MAG: hypothetical protein LUQ68_07280 [Methylococcaceae bacterium]|nr:hypothetical protein [Methylococcaceae bacterium]
MQAVAEGEINDAVFAAKRHRRFGPMLGQWTKSPARSACEYYCESLIHINTLFSDFNYLTIHLTPINGQDIFRYLLNSKIQQLG